MTKAILVASLVRRFADHVERTFAFRMAREQMSYKGDAALFNKALDEGQQAFKKFLGELHDTTVGDLGTHWCDVYDLAAQAVLDERTIERERQAPRRVATAEAWARKRVQMALVLAAKKSAAVAAAH